MDILVKRTRGFGVGITTGSIIHIRHTIGLFLLWVRGRRRKYFLFCGVSKHRERLCSSFGGCWETGYQLRITCVGETLLIMMRPFAPFFNKKWSRHNISSQHAMWWRLFGRCSLGLVMTLQQFYLALSIVDLLPNDGSTSSSTFFCCCTEWSKSELL